MLSSVFLRSWYFLLTCCNDLIKFIYFTIFTTKYLFKLIQYKRDCAKDEEFENTSVTLNIISTSIVLIVWILIKILFSSFTKFSNFMTDTLFDFYNLGQFKCFIICSLLLDKTLFLNLLEHPFGNFIEDFCII